MLRIACALLLLPLAAPACAKEGDVFFCYWVDRGRNEILTTDTFPADRKSAREIVEMFAADMRERTGRDTRMRDCTWKRGRREAGNALDRLHAVHLHEGRRVVMIDWTPAAR